MVDLPVTGRGASRVPLVTGLVREMHTPPRWCATAGQKPGRPRSPGRLGSGAGRSEVADGSDIRQCASADPNRLELSEQGRRGVSTLSRFSTVPTVDVSGLFGSIAEQQAVAREIGTAARDVGFF